MTWGKARREPAVPAVPAGGIQGVCRMAGPTGLTDGLLGLFPSWDLPLPPAGQKMCLVPWSSLEAMGRKLLGSCIISRCSE